MITWLINLRQILKSADMCTTIKYSIFLTLNNALQIQLCIKLYSKEMNVFFSHISTHLKLYDKQMPFKQKEVIIVHSGYL